MCLCCALSHPPVARGRPSAYDRRAPVPLTLTLILDLAITLSSFPRAPAPLVRLSPFFSRSLASSPPFYLHSNRNPRSTIFVPALAHRSTHWSDRIRESRLPDHQLPESVEALQASRRVGSGQIRLAAPHSALPLSSHHPVFPSFARQGSTPPTSPAPVSRSASCVSVLWPCLALLLPPRRTTRPTRPGQVPLPPALQQTRHPSPPGPRSPPPAPPSLSLKPAKPPRRQFPPFLAFGSGGILADPQRSFMSPVFDAEVPFLPPA